MGEAENVEDADDRDAAPAEAARGQGDASPEAPRRKSGSVRWWAALAAILLVELFIYGRRAEIEVCAGKQNVHDFALLGQERTDENRWKFPRCETRMNLGLRSHYDEAAAEAAKVACRGATVFRHRGEGNACLEQADGWTHRIDARYVWPFDERFYEHLFWFLQ